MSINSPPRRFRPIMSSHVPHLRPITDDSPDPQFITSSTSTSSSTSRMKEVDSPLMAHRMWVEPSTPTSQLSPRHIPPPMSTWNKLAYAMGHVLNDMSAACWFSYLLILLTKVQGLSSYHAGIVLLSGQIADAIATPLVGIFSDSSHGWEALKLGRRKLYYAFGTIIVMINYFFVFGYCIPCHFYTTEPIPTQMNINGTTIPPVHDEVAHYSSYDEMVLVAYYAIAASLFNVGWASIQVSHMSLVPELSTDEHERVVLNSARYAFTVGSNILVFVVLFIFVYALHFDKQQQFHYLAYVSLVVGTTCAICFLTGTHEQPAREHHANKSGNFNWRNWFKVVEFYTVGIVYMCTRLVVNVSQVYLPLFVCDTLFLSEVFITIIPCVVYISSFVSAALMKRINKRIGRMKTFALGTLLCASALVGLMLIGEEEWYLIFPCSILLGLGNATIMVCSVQLEADLVGLNNASGAFVYGALSFTDKLSNGVAIFFLQFHDTHTPSYTRHCVTIVPLAACALALCVAFTIDVKKLNKTDQTDDGYQALNDGQQEEEVMSSVVEDTSKPSTPNPWRRRSSASIPTAG